MHAYIPTPSRPTSLNRRRFATLVPVYSCSSFLTLSVSPLSGALICSPSRPSLAAMVTTTTTTAPHNRNRHYYHATDHSASILRQHDRSSSLIFVITILLPHHRDQSQ
eukprot:GHVU01226546.1.p1 GENE.GHVU01226546.1~~GHVU01226546.1.p1  ORF type:complete len:108 (-),score=0.90 GHVU01226546.1:118-441(-)